MNEKVILSISILISNRPDTVGKCLQSLNSLRKNVSTELILVDTGCGAEVRRMIEPYADEIIDFEWCNDFAKARNAGLKHAKGEWFMYMDDDEWFEDTQDIEEFFLSGKYQEYNYAYYVVRNYTDLEGKEYVDGTVGRMIRLTPDTKFAHSIHECFNHVSGPIIRLHSYAHHYGYAYHTAEERMKHFDRNMKMLEEEHKRDPEELRHVNQMAQEYNGISDWRKSLEISEEGVRVGPTSGSNIHYLNGLYANIVRSLNVLKRYDEAILRGREFLEKPETNELAKAMIYCYLTWSYFGEKKYPECLKAVEAYLTAYEKHKENQDMYMLHENVLLSTCFQAEGYTLAFGMAVRSAIASGDTESVRKYFHLLDWNVQCPHLDYPMIDIVSECIKAWLCADAEQVAEYEPLVKVFLNNEICTKIVTTCLELWLKKEPDLFDKTNARWDNYTDKGWLFLYLALRSQSGKEKAQQKREEICLGYNELWNDMQTALSRSVELGIWNMAETDGVSIESFIMSQPFFKWQRAVETTCRKIPFSELTQIEDKIESFENQEHANVKYWKMLYQRICIDRHACGEDTLEQKCELDRLFQYADDVLDFYRGLYKAELFTVGRDLLPQECLFSLQLQDMRQAVDKGDYGQALKCVKDALHIMPEWASVCRDCTEWVNEQYAAGRVEQAHINYEFKRMAEAVKLQIRSFIQAGNIAEAHMVLQQLKALLPDDAEVIRLEQDICDKRSGAECEDSKM